jgi:hypothetical protein
MPWQIRCAAVPLVRLLVQASNSQPEAWRWNNPGLAVVTITPITMR